MKERNIRDLINPIHYSILKLVIVLLSLTGSHLFARTATIENQAIITSPDGRLALSVDLDRGKPVYKVLYDEKVVLDQSPLGLITNMGDFSRDMKFISAERSQVDYAYSLKKTKKREIQYNANQLTYRLSNIDDHSINIISGSVTTILPFIMCWEKLARQPVVSYWRKPPVSISHKPPLPSFHLKPRQ